MTTTTQTPAMMKFRLKKSKEVMVEGKKLWVGAELESEFLKEHKDEEIQKVIDELDILLEEEIRREQDKADAW